MEDTPDARTLDAQCRTGNEFVQLSNEEMELVHGGDGEFSWDIEANVEANVTGCYSLVTLECR